MGKVTGTVGVGIVIGMLVTMLMGACAAPTPERVYISGAATPTPQAGDPARPFQTVKNAEVDVARLATGTFADGLHRFQDTVDGKTVTCYIVEGYNAMGIDCVITGVAPAQLSSE